MNRTGTFVPSRPGLRAHFSLLARALLVLVVVGSVLAIGSVHVPVLVVVALAATASTACAVLGGARISGSPFVWLLLGLLLYTLLQTFPLPPGLLARLAPNNYEVWHEARQLVGAGQSDWLPLSLDPGATRVEVLKLWTYLCALITATSAASTRGAVWIALLLAGSALLLTLITLAHGVSDATQVFGVYTPRLGGQGFRVAPLINPNNLAGYLALGTAAGLALLATDAPPIPRWVSALALLPILGMALLTGSRAGILALTVTVGLGVWLLRPRQSESRALRQLYRQFVKASGLVLATAVLLAVATSGSRLWHMLMEDNFAKLSLAKASLPLVSEYRWLGLGRGAFESVFPALHAAPDNSIFSHPENFLLQWATEWGLPVTLVLVVAVVAFGWRFGGVWLGDSRVRRALLAGVVALTVQNLFDLGFEVPGVMIGLVVALGALAPGRQANGNGSRSRRRAQSWRRPALASGLLLAGTLLAVWSYRTGKHTLTVDRDNVRATIPEDPKQPEQFAQFKQAAVNAMLRHPAEPYFPRLAALVIWRAGQNPLPWLNRALERGMSAGRTHYLLGAVLASIGKKNQALLELRYAASLDGALTPRIAAVALDITREQNDLLHVAPAGADGARLLLALATQLPKESEVVSLALIEEAIRREPHESRPRLGLVRRLLASIQEQHPGCGGEARPSCVERVQAQLSFLEKQRPPLPELPIWKARLQVVMGAAPEAVRALSTTCPTLEDRLPCLRAWLEAVTASRDLAALSKVCQAIREEGCGAEKSCANLLWASGEAAVTLGNPELALAQFEQAAQQENTPGRWRAVARQAQRNGYFARALRAMDRAVSLAPDDATVAKERNAVRQAALRALP